MSTTRGIWIVVVLLVIVLGSSCKSVKGVPKTPDALKSSASDLYSSLIDRKPDFRWFSGKARMKAETEMAEIGAGVKLRMLRDSAIWLSIDKFGFEMGRALLTPDSIWMIDRLNKEYYALDFDSTLGSYGVPFSFADLQFMLIGGTADIEPLAVHKVDDPDFHSLVIDGSDLRAQYWFDDQLELRKGRVEDYTGRRVEMENGDFREVGSETLPFDKYLAMFGSEESALLRLQFAEIELDVPRSFAFDIPDHYQRVD